MSENFDPVARSYRWLERLAFGRDLERCRFHYLEALAGRRRVLILGEGDGRFLAALLRRFPEVAVECIEASPAMVALANGRLTPSERARVHFRCEDALAARFEAGAFDAVVTLFFLDCFSAAQVEAAVNRVRGALRPGAVWLWADFCVPESGWRRLRARAWLGLLYAFFRRFAGLTIDELPPASAIIERAGFRCRDRVRFQAGLLESAVFDENAGAPPPIT